MTEYPIINFYCDESCHLPMKTDGAAMNGARQVMAIGGMWCPRTRARDLTERLRAVKVRHGLQRTFELKWQKVSPAKAALYLELLDVFLAEEDLHFRAAVVPNKQAFFKFHEEASLGGDHDGAYYRLYFDMLKVVFDPCFSYHIYLDAKDTRGRFKLADLRRTLEDSKFYEVPPHVVGRLQEIRSHESDLLQLADIILGALTFVQRGLHEQPGANAGKVAIVRHLQEKTGYSLQRSTLHGEPKLNLWVWHSSHHPNDRYPETSVQEATTGDE